LEEEKAKLLATKEEFLALQKVHKSLAAQNAQLQSQGEQKEEQQTKLMSELAAQTKERRTHHF
jgi:hypothetical protein